MMSNHQPPSLPRYFNRTSLGSVLETRCRTAIDAFEGLQICNAIALLASAKERAIEAASNIARDHSFRFFSSPLPQPPTLTPNDAVMPEDASFVGHLNYGKWVAKQREQYRFYREGKHCFLTEECIDLLKSVEFVWQIKGRQSIVVDLAAALQAFNPNQVPLGDPRAVAALRAAQLGNGVR